MKKITYALLMASLIVLMTSSASKASLNVGVSVANPHIQNMEKQVITAVSNEKGKGILLVIQPAEGTPWVDYLNSHPLLLALWNMLPSNVRSHIDSLVGGKIVSYSLISMDSGGGVEMRTFPDDFTGINGAPSTALTGMYKVIFAFLHFGLGGGLFTQLSYCELFEADFACSSWFVVPEIPIGTIVPLSTMVAVLAAIALYKKQFQNNGRIAIH